MGRKSREKREYREFAAAFVPQPTSRLADVRWGIGWGLGFSALFSLYVLGVSVVRGPDAFSRYNLSAWQIIAIYVVAGVLSGALAGFLRKYGAQSRRRARMAGALVGAVVYGCTGIAIFGITTSSVLSSILIGVPMGLFVTGQWQRRGMFDPLLPDSRMGLHQKWREHQRAGKPRP